MFDDMGEGYITVDRFREILKEIDSTITEEELDGIISEVRHTLNYQSWENSLLFQVDDDGSGTIDFDEFCTIIGSD